MNLAATLHFGGDTTPCVGRAARYFAAGLVQFGRHFRQGFGVQLLGIDPAFNDVFLGTYLKYFFH